MAGRARRPCARRARGCAGPADRARSVVAGFVGRARAFARRRVAADGRRRSAQRADYGVVLRKTDGSQPIRLGEGSPPRLSPDGKWAAAIIAAPPRLVLYPTGAGEPIRLNAGPIERLISVEWFPDGRRLLVCGSEPARAPRCYAQDLAGVAADADDPRGRPRHARARWPDAAAHAAGRLVAAVVD